jgi:UDP-GlcNAc:undecaprenyl-phosphate GlcNAc-1-phosphate transferase
VTTRLVIAGVGAVAIALVTTPLSMVLARRLGVVDRPAPLKPQTTAVPYLGGAAVFAAAIVGGAMGRPLLLVPLGAALVLGAVDDAVHLPPWFRLVGQAAIGGATAAVVHTRLPGAVGPVLVVAVAVLLMNGVNMIDGLDALAAGLVAVAMGAFAWLLRGDDRLLALALAGALVGFLAYNRPPARIYLGDGGSYLLGTALTVLLASAWASGVRTPVAVSCLVVVAAPAAEVLFAVVRRLRSRRSLVLGDRGHPYDRLVAAGWPVLAASSLYIAIELVLAAAAVAVAASHSLVPALVAVVVVAVGLVGAALATGVLTPEQGADA